MNWNKATTKYVLFGVVLILAIWGLTSALSTSDREERIDRATDLYQSGKLDDAAREYSEIVADSPNDPVAWNNLGNVLRDQKKYAEASDAYKRAISLDQKYEASYRNLSFLYIDLEKIQKQEGKIDEAIQIALDGFKASGSKSIGIAEDLVTLYNAKGDTAKASEYKAIRDRLLEEE